MSPYTNREKDLIGQPETILIGADILQRIQSAFQRTANIDSSRISVDIVGSRVVLQGAVRSFAEKEDAENAAWTVPGVTSVENRLEIKMPEYGF
jgi:osmotically-inducible protein OsmY